MNVIVPLFLMLLAFAGGVAITYVLMDTPRRQAKDRLRRLEQQWRDAEEFQAGLDDREERLEARVAEFKRYEAAFRTRDQTLTARQQEFDRKVITYTELEKENRLLRSELKNHAVHTAFLEHLRQSDRAGHSTVTEQRDELGHAYFKEVVGWTRKSITTSNLPQSNQRVRTAAEWIRGLGVELTPEAEREALGELRKQFEKAVRLQAEREHQAELREQIREEQRRQREIEEAEEQQREAERQRREAEEALARAKAEAAREAAEEFGKQSAEAAAEHAERIAELQAQLAQAIENSQRAISNAQLTRKGCVYVISNIGSFGEGLLKIGMTRRHDPMDRIRELGDASVPFPFDVHMKITCDDAPALEKALHREFHHLRKNKVNLRKEFFEVSIHEVAKAVERLHGEVEYVADAEALDYRNSLIATDADQAEIDEAFREDDEDEDQEDEDEV
jgi:hypothetical protein